jgi:antitoxin (DNA-binding transcriptional repressor) of toxin-antitoxin stability system
MKSVGIRALKDNLSKYLKMVGDGEIILVTDRDEVIAEIHQPERQPLAGASRLETFLEKEARRGSVVRARPGSAPPLSLLRNMPRPRVRVDLQLLLDQVRAD